MKDYAELYKDTREMLAQYCYENTDITITSIARDLGMTPQPLRYLSAGKVLRPNNLYKIHKYLIEKGAATISS